MNFAVADSSATSQGLGHRCRSLALFVRLNTIHARIRFVRYSPPPTATGQGSDHSIGGRHAFDMSTMYQHVLKATLGGLRSRSGVGRSIP